MKKIVNVLATFIMAVVRIPWVILKSIFLLPMETFTILLGVVIMGLGIFAAVSLSEKSIFISTIPILLGLLLSRICVGMMWENIDCRTKFIALWLSIVPTWKEKYLKNN